MSAALALVPAPTDLSPARAALIDAYVQRDALQATSGKILAARERLREAEAAEDAAKAALSALAAGEAEAYRVWALSTRGPEPRPNLEARRAAEDRLAEAKARADAARGAATVFTSGMNAAERESQRVEASIASAVNAILLEELQAETEIAERTFAAAVERVKSLRKLAGVIVDALPAPDRALAGECAFRAGEMSNLRIDHHDLGDWDPAHRAVERLTADLRTEPTATLSLD
ncbi:hypothetical protein [Methylobacterium sp. J-070]|uniref:hypothetical protein n=1 Tax=Methylobacterium sp. J-070 TaxID=2836650 RepID=UPI001FB87A66|nr:hypothetical protein [Methylobacterium sp. J-070]MCJ2048529.1 hypothetical protein [Methylobacterium sp. J-070]